ncbi:SDR family oxidoreductase [Agreia sp. COWG]|uniref:SDR family oxidoreductase n=1 Tax=Agreia sp. COWG TaxID=2773266 RepID=UPI0019265A9E|nr:SDR family oxidoreductase [Agreia sp. COWG]CAD5995542.1 NAD(P)-dependent oxidoreductase [Agreia sp. COWG]
MIIEHPAARAVPSLAVTGATGHLGGIVARGLAELGVEQTLVVREASRAPRLEGSVVREAQYRDPVASRAALEGVHTLFMVSGSESVDRVAEHRSFIDAAAAAGVSHIVYTSFFGASPDAVFTLARDHFATEQHIQDSGLDFTFLRNNFYLDFFALLAGEDGVIRGPAGLGRVSAVSRADLARSALAVLRDPAAHAGAVYELTGREAISLDEVARIVTDKTGRSVTFHDETVPEAYASRAVYGAAPWQVDAWVSTYTAFAAGEQQRITGDVRALTGHEPATLAEFLDASA